MPQQSRHAAVKSGERRSRAPRSSDSDSDHDQPVMAFGDHMPDFLKRPVKLPPLRKEESALAEAYSKVLARRDTLIAEERQLAAAVAEADQQARQLANDRAHEERQQGEAVTVEARLAAEADRVP